MDLRACIWCLVQGVGCSISQRGKGARGARSPKKDSGKGKRKASEVSKGEESDEGRVAKKARSSEVILVRSPPPTFALLLPPLPSPATPLFLSSLPSPVPSEVQVAIPPAAPQTLPVFALTDAICKLSKVVGQLWDEMAEVWEGMEELRAHSRVHQKLVEVQLDRERRRNLVGLMRTTRGVNKIWHASQSNISTL